MYVLPSVSTFTNRNPSVTRFEYNKDTFELLDYTVRDGGDVDGEGDGGNNNSMSSNSSSNNSYRRFTSPICHWQTRATLQTSFSSTQPESTLGSATCRLQGDAQGCEVILIFDFVFMYMLLLNAQRECSWRLEA